jgi:hypothetical protein
VEPLPFGVLVRGPTAEPSPYLAAIFGDADARAAFFAFVDAAGLVVARDLLVDPAPYRAVRGRRSPGRLSQGEYYHHDGCSSPTKPRIVEIHCPVQAAVRSMGTSVARFPHVVVTMLEGLPASLSRRAEIEDLRAAARAGELLDWDHAQGLLNRLIRQLDTASARAWFHDVDAHAGSFTAPWTLGESRFIANDCAGPTAQHRRACAEPWVPGVPNGQLIKRWPAEELLVEGECARGECDTSD